MLHSTLLSELQASLPPHWHEPLEQLATATLNTDTPLRVTLVGAFSVGKSSLLNMLIGKPLLPAALEETTALPTFIEYATRRSLQQLAHDGTVTELDETRFAAAVTRAPQGAACAVIQLPLDWLQGISIIDLPGLGSLSASHRAYTLAQIQQADAVLYLISPRGPTREDLDTLAHARQTGKHIKLLVSQWDVITDAEARGEPLPSLEQWAREIETATQQLLPLTPCNQAGLGRQAILAFLQQARQDREVIRLCRFQAELKPLLENALGHNADLQQSCETQSEADIQSLHETLIQRKQALVEFKSGLYERQRADMIRIEEQCQAITSAERTQLVAQLLCHAETLVNEADWQTFGSQGDDWLKTRLATVASAFSQLSHEYGDLALPEAQIAAFNLRLPAPETVDAAVFLDAGQLTQLQNELMRQQADIARLEGKLAELNPSDMSGEELALFELLQQRESLASQPLPYVIRETSKSNARMIGRLLGEALDIGLIVANPTVVGTKIASLIGIGAKTAKIAVDVAKVTEVAVKTVEIGQALQNKNIPQPILDKLGALEMLSFGYWGERLGSAMGGGPSGMKIIDPEALAQQQATLTHIEQETRKLRQALSLNEKTVQERQLTGWALEQSQKEQAHLEEHLQQLQAQAERAYREADEYQQIQRQKQLRHYAEQAVSRWLNRFDQHIDGMQELLRTVAKNHWEERVTALVNERLQELDGLYQQTEATAEEKQRTLTCLQEEAKALAASIRLLA